MLLLPSFLLLLLVLLTLILEQRLRRGKYLNELVDGDLDCSGCGEGVLRGRQGAVEEQVEEVVPGSLRPKARQRAAVDLLSCPDSAVRCPAQKYNSLLLACFA